MGETLFELEYASDRTELAALLRGLADAFEAGTTVDLHTAETQLAVEVPQRVFADLEAEHEDGTTALELKLEWDDADGTSVRVTDASTAADERPLTEERDEPTSAATATIPPDAVAGSDAGPAADGTTDADSREDGRRSRFEIYRDRADEWRWRLVHWNGNIIADSGEGYASRSNAERAVRGVVRNASDARIEHLEEDA
ncbi:amphi-Trp domain-containing protein [Natronococcus occultus]|uniref:Uncharacterized protein n=1 Tax=Natronococcus occultus SP4 TaxID=694430 RepID=L0JTC7_9EURY|nr:amphi-Trp domain-containing protein [Natronococcus occultus]AGB36262.1 hypothetical protein Natoc_0397 [Natronococcus occultus SP4]